MARGFVWEKVAGEKGLLSKILKSFLYFYFCRTILLNSAKSNQPGQIMTANYCICQGCQSTVNCYIISTRFFIGIVKEWKDLPKNIVEAETFNLFNLRLRLHMNLYFFFPPSLFY